MTTCPHCGRPLRLVAANDNIGGGWHINRTTTFNNAVTAIGQPAGQGGIPQFTEAERRAPARPASLESDVFVPATQAFITGAIAIIPGAFITAFFELPWYSAIEIGAGVMTISWLYLLDAHRKLLWLVERVSNSDINRDGVTGEPEPQRVVLEVQQETGHGRNYKLFDLPPGVTMAMLREFAQGWQVRGLAQSAWTGRGNTFSRSQYDALMAALHQAGIVRWVDEQNRAQGRTVTNAGRAALKYIAEE